MSTALYPHHSNVFMHQALTQERSMRCSTRLLAQLLLQQWKRLTRSELEKTHFDKHSIALLIEQKYGINHVLAENYLSNIERTLPISA